MDVRAILLTGIPLEPSNGSVRTKGSRETFSGVPLVFLPALGQTILQRIASRFEQARVDSVTVLNAADSSLPFTSDARCSNLKWKDVPAEQIWRAAEDEFSDAVQAGAEQVIVVRLGAYTEIEIDPLLQFHLDQRNHITQVAAKDGALDFFVLSASRRNDAAYLFRNKLTQMRVQTKPFVTSGYVNRLCDASDLRRLVLDSFLQKTCIQPVGAQVRPGVWVGAGAKIDRSVRLVAPCYIGAYSRIRAGALITRGTSIEHHSLVDCGSVVEASVLLPLSYLGAGLDMMHSVLGLKRIVSTRHRAELEVEDATLASTVPATSTVRTLSHAANLITYLPRQILRTFIGSRKQRVSQVDPECPASSFDPTTAAHPASKDRQPLTTTAVAGMREYGNQ